MTARVIANISFDERIMGAVNGDEMVKSVVDRVAFETGRILVVGRPNVARQMPMQRVPSEGCLAFSLKICAILFITRN